MKKKDTRWIVTIRIMAMMLIKFCSNTRSKNSAIQETKADLIKSLEKGKLQSVQMNVNGKETMHFIQADPRYKEVNIYNSANARLKKEEVTELKAAVSGEPSRKQEQKQQKPQQEDGGGDDVELKKKTDAQQQ